MAVQTHRFTIGAAICGVCGPEFCSKALNQSWAWNHQFSRQWLISFTLRNPGLNVLGREKKKTLKFHTITGWTLQPQITFHHVCPITCCLFPQFPSASRHNPGVIYARPARNWVTAGAFSIKMKATWFIWHAAPLGGHLNMRRQGIMSGHLHCSLAKWKSSGGSLGCNARFLSPWQG